MADTEQGNSGGATSSSDPPTALISWLPVPPSSLEEAREWSRAVFPTGHSWRLTFSSLVKRVFDPAGERGSTKDCHLAKFLRTIPSQRRRGAADDLEYYDTLRFYVPATPEAPRNYNETHSRKAFYHDIAFAVRKQNKVAAAIRKCGYVIDYSVVDAHLLIIFGHFMTSLHGRPTSAARNDHVTYEVGYNPQYQSLVRRVTDIAVIQAWESLTKEKCMQWLAHKPDDPTPYWVSAFVYDKVAASGELSFDVEVVFQKLPVNSVPLNVFCDEHGDEAEQRSVSEEQARLSLHRLEVEKVARVWSTVEDSDCIIDIKGL